MRSSSPVLMLALTACGGSDLLAAREADLRQQMLGIGPPVVTDVPGSTTLASQNWNDNALITTSDVWPGTIPFIGYQTITPAPVGTDPQLFVAPSLTLDVNVNQTAPNTFSTGGVTEFHLTDSVVALAGSGTATAPNLVVTVNATGLTNIRVTANLRDIDGSVDNAVQPVALQYRVGGTGNFVNVPAAYVADASSGPSLATLVTATDATLPSAANGAATLEIRWISVNASGNDEWIGIDDIVISGSTAGPSVAENTGAGVLVQDMEGTDPDGGSLTWAITAGNDDGAFTIEGATGIVRTSGAPVLNFEAASSRVLTVQATATDGDVDTGSLTVTVTDVAEAPVFVGAPYAANVAETAAPGAIGVDVDATDPENNAITYAITAGNVGGAFAIDASTGVITLVGALDFETTPSYALTVTATDSTALVREATVTVTVTDVVEVSDTDGDGIDDPADNCPLLANADQANADGDPLGDACDACDLGPNVDADSDGVFDACDDCDLGPNVDADSDGLFDACDACDLGPNVDADSDGLFDACDACDLGPNVDADSDGVFDACDACDLGPNVDADGDGAFDACDICPNDPTNDADADGICAPDDLCPNGSNTDDADADGIPDGCDPGGVAVINEILADPGVGIDANCDGTASTTNDEFVELVNVGPGDLDLSGATLSDSFSTRHTFPAGTVVPYGGAIVVFAAGTPKFDGTSLVVQPWCVDLPDDVLVQVANTAALGLNNTGDTVTLKSVGGFTLTSYVYGAEAGSDQSITRATQADPAASFVQHLTLASYAQSPGTRPGGGTFGDGDGDGIFSADDCDDANPAVGLPTLWYADGDGDGYGDPLQSVVQCDAPAAFVANDADCDDGTAARAPGAAELCDGVDNDCDLVVPATEVDGDGDGLLACEDTCDLGPNTDGDGDGVFDACDVCPNGSNVTDTDGDGVPDGCDPGGTPVLNEILADPGPGIDASCDGVTSTTTDEFVEIVNVGPGALDLSGATLSDSSAVRHVFPAGSVVPEGGALVVFGGGTPTFDGTSGVAQPWCVDLPGTVLVQVATTASLVLSNTADTVTLTGLGGFVLGSYSWGAEGNLDQSLTRGIQTDPGSPFVGHLTLSTWAQSPGQRPVGGSFVDADRDGIFAEQDCDDAAPAIGLATLWFLDADGDGWVDAADAGVPSCGPLANRLEEGSFPGVDCNDASAAQFSGNPEVCDGLDNDCDGALPATEGNADGDALVDCADACDLGPNVDADGDGAFDACDACPVDAPDDTDGDGLCDTDDACDAGPNVDGDGDGAFDACDACPTDNPDDSDGDGVCEGADACDVGPNVDTDGDLVFDACDSCPIDAGDDSDGDGSCDSVDICPGGDDLVDGDGDAIPDACDACPVDAPNDTDADGVCESVDICPGASDLDDSDNDGVPNGCDDCVGAVGDTDGDGVADACDICPLDDPNDSDGDAVCDSADLCVGGDDAVDTDGDSVADFCDACPVDFADDTDGDGVCDSDDQCVGGADGDDADSDGVADFCDACPADPLDDSDGDGVCDSLDVCAGDDAVDTDNDGVADACDLCPADALDDSDGDGVCDSDDVCAGDDTVDTDGDGAADACDTCPADALDDSDGDGVCDSADVCAGDDTVDTDGDGVADACDTCPADPLDDSDLDTVCDSDDLCDGGDDTVDFDADGQPDACDACPLDFGDDSDLDTVCDSDDLCVGGDDLVDGDSDGFADACDLCPVDPTNDSDADTVCDSADICDGFDDLTDTDGDGVPNGCDDCDGSLDDFDGDGVVDACDACPVDNPDDTDGDGVCDEVDGCDGDDRIDSDGDTAPDACDPCPSDFTDDSDGDGVCDSEDACIGGADGADLDGDLVPDACDLCPLDAAGDSDGDGSCDSDDPCPTDPLDACVVGDTGDTGLPTTPTTPPVDTGDTADTGLSTTTTPPIDTGDTADTGLPTGTVTTPPVDTADTGLPTGTVTTPPVDTSDTADTGLPTVTDTTPPVDTADTSEPTGPTGPTSPTDTLPTGSVPDAGDTGAVDEEKGCNCASAPSSPAASFAWLALAGAFLARRRRAA